MKVDACDMDFYSQHAFLHQERLRERLEVRWVPSSPPSTRTSSGDDLLTISPDARLKQRVRDEEHDIDKCGLETKIRLVEILLSALSGRKIRIIRPEEPHGEGSDEDAGARGGTQALISPGEDSSVNTISASYERTYSLKEEEFMKFQGRGWVKTDDGRFIAIDFNLALSRRTEFTQTFRLRFGAAAEDPLILNLTGGPLELGKDTMLFDLDGDGMVEKIPTPAENSAYLALDINGDGVINNGHELFGPTSGDGFSELVGFDVDKNGWIDENDPIYKDLRLWVKEEGRDFLFALEEKDIGAIYLGRIGTRFSFTDGINHERGELVSCSVYLGNDGRVGAVGQINVIPQRQGVDVTI